MRNTIATLIRLWPTNIAVFLVTYCALYYSRILIGSYVYFVHAASVALLSYFLSNALVRYLSGRIRVAYINPLNKAVFITGCDSGFGYCLAQKLDELGFWVYAGCFHPLDEGAQTLNASTSRRLLICPLDVTKEDDVRKAVDLVKATLSGKELWALVNNANTAVGMEFELCPLEYYRHLYEVNCLGPIRITKAFLPLLQKSCGRLVNVTSATGRIAAPGLSAYCMSKSGMVALTDVCRMELKKWGISTHSIEPFIYKAGLLQSNITSFSKREWKNLPNEIKETYGEEYFQDSLRSIDDYMRFTRVNIKDVVEDMVDAVASEEPKIRYVPNGSTELLFSITSCLPITLLDFLFHLFQPSSPPVALQLPTTHKSKTFHAFNNLLSLLKSEQTPGKSKSMEKLRCFINKKTKKMIHEYYNATHA